MNKKSINHWCRHYNNTEIIMNLFFPPQSQSVMSRCCFKMLRLNIPTSGLAFSKSSLFSCRYSGFVILWAHSQKAFYILLLKRKASQKPMVKSRLKLSSKHSAVLHTVRIVFILFFLLIFFLLFLSLFFHFRFEIIMYYAKHNFIALFLFSGLAQLQMSTIFNGRLPFVNISTQFTLFSLQGHNIFTTNTL